MTQGIDLYYSYQGEGEPVIVIHGGPGLDHTYLNEVYLQLAKQFGVVCYDQRCSGESGGNPTLGTITLGTFLHDLEALRKGLGFETVHILGHSWGAFLAMIYACRFPDRVKSVVLMNPSPATYEGMRELAVNVQKRHSPEDREALARLSISEPFLFGEVEPVNTFMTLWFKAYLADPSRVNLLDFRLAPRTAKNWARINSYMLRQLGAFDVRRELAQIYAPTLVISGSKDIIPEYCVEDILINITTSRKKLIEGTGHFSFLEAPDQVYPAITSFLKSII